MRRRTFLKMTGTASIGLSVAGLPPSLLPRTTGRSGLPAAGKKDRRPNLLLIMTDQQFADALGCAGAQDLKTPAMDSLAGNGLRFSRAYCIQPLCVPSRVGMFTGRYPHEAGAPINQNVRENSILGPMMGAIFSDAGYETYYAGKWHLGIPMEQADVHGFRHMAYIRDNRVDPDVPKGTAEFFRQITGERPFLMVASLVDPHDICQYVRGEDFPNGDIGYPPHPDLCPELPSNFDIPKNEPEIIRKQQENSYPTYPTRVWRDGLWRQYRWAYHRMIELVDSRIGEILGQLRASGFEENTVVIFTSDHGDGYGAHKWNQKQVLYEETARVPFIISWKGKTGPKVDDTTLVNVGLDLIPTMCAFAGIRPPAHMRGVSLKALAEGKKPEWSRDHIVIETEFCTFNKSYGIRGRCVRTGQFKYIVYDQGECREQLFDMKSDPGEMNNLAFDEGMKSILVHHRDLLLSWIKETGDHFQMQE